MGDISDPRRNRACVVSAKRSRIVRQAVVPFPWIEPRSSTQDDGRDTASRRMAYPSLWEHAGLDVSPENDDRPKLE